MTERPEYVTEAEWLRIGASAAVDELTRMSVEARWHIEADHLEDAQLELQKASEWLTHCRRQVDRWALERAEIAAEPTEADYIQGRARMTAVSEWAKTGRRLEWADNTVRDREGS